MAVTDLFNRADGGLGADWETVDGAGGAISGNAAIGTDAGDYSASRYNAVEFNADQRSLAQKADANNYIAVAVRMTTGGNFYGFFSHGSLQKLVNGAQTEISNAGTTVSLNELMELVVSGTDLEMFIQGLSRGGTSDATHSGGKAGIAFFDNPAKLDNWVAEGEITARRVFLNA